MQKKRKKFKVRNIYNSKGILTKNIKIQNSFYRYQKKKKLKNKESIDIFY